MESKSYFQKNIEELQKEFDVDIHAGLSVEEAEKRKNIYGENALKQTEKKSFLQMFFSQLKDFMIIILIIASFISLIVGEVADTVIILLVVILNAVLGVIQENKAEKSLEALKNLSSPAAKVVRGGRKMEVKSKNIVPGDIVIIEAGDIAPADGVLFQSANLMMEEAALTGESVPVEKNTAIPQGEDIPLGDRKNYIYTSSLAVYGRGQFIVTATGMNTEVGKIAEMLQKEEKIKTPLQEKLDELGKTLGIAVLVICALLFGIGYFQNRSLFEMFMTSISLAVAAIPEGLPAIVTIVLSIGVQRMIKRNAIIRKLPAVETLGTASVICSDKTGTLTQNKMTVTKIYTYDKLVDIDQADKDQPKEELALKIGLLCNDASLDEEDGEKKAVGDPTEVALVAAAHLHGLFKKEEESKSERVNEIPFDSDRKLMTTIHRYGKDFWVYTKGAPDVLLERCDKILLDDGIATLDEEMKSNIKKANEEMSSQALRVIALAYQEMSSLPERIVSEEIEDHLIFVGMAGMIDPPREEVKESVRISKEAGVRPVMITGDHKLTAMTIAKELGILDEGQEAIEGRVLEKMSDEDLFRNVERYSVYARVSPEHKVRIVKAWQQKGRIVAMTGDGVNDAPALKRANIGCAMGITGTDVSKEAADMVLTDDNFATIVSAIEEGRSIFDNIKKSIHFLLSCNIGEVVALAVCIVLNYPIPLLPIHILWVNLVTDSFPALALGVDPAEKDIMKRKPRDPKESIFGGGLGLVIALEGAAIGILTVIAFQIGRAESLELGRSMAFVVLSLSQLFHTFNVRAMDKSIFQVGFTSNKQLLGALFVSFLLMIGILVIPPLRDIFKLALIDSVHWGILLGISLMILVVVELAKGIKRLI